MKVLITGAQGQVGRTLAAPVPQGWRALALGRNDRPPHWRVNLRTMLQEEQQLG